MADATDERISYMAGLSLGQANQATGFAVLERRCPAVEPGRRTEAAYALRHLVRYPPGTPYASIVAELTGVFAKKPLKGSPLMVDQTAVDRGVYELFWNGRTGASVQGLTVTAGYGAGTDDHGGRLVPKKDFVGALQVLLQGKRLKVALALAMAGTLAEDLQQFRLKAVPLTDDVVDWRERPHDDLVFAVAAWQGERHSLLFFIRLDKGKAARRGPGGRSPTRG